MPFYVLTCADFFAIAAAAPTPNSPNPAPKYGLSFKECRISPIPMFISERQQVYNCFMNEKQHFKHTLNNNI